MAERHLAEGQGLIAKQRRLVRRFSISWRDGFVSTRSLSRNREMLPSTTRRSMSSICGDRRPFGRPMGAVEGPARRAVALGAVGD